MVGLSLMIRIIPTLKNIGNSKIINMQYDSQFMYFILLVLIQDFKIL